MTAVLFQVTLDVTQEWNIAETGDDEDEERAKEDDDSEQDGEQQHLGHKWLFGPVSGNGVQVTVVD